MRRKYQRQSYLTPIFWSVALIAVTGYSGWRFGWFPSASIRFSEAGTAQLEPAEQKKQPELTEVAQVDPAPLKRSHRTTPPPLFEAPQTAPEPITETNTNQHSVNPFSSQSSPSEPDSSTKPTIQTVSNESAQELPSDATTTAPATRIATAVSEKPVASPFAKIPEPVQPEFDFRSIDQLIEQGEYLKAHKMMSQLYWKKPALRESMFARLNTTARSIFFDKQPHYLTPYIIQPGDQLQNIASLYQVSWEYLSNLNQVDPRKIRVDQKLKVLKGPFSAVVDLSDFELTIHSHGYFVKRYQVGIGKAGSSPIGKFTVLDKLKDPTYYGPDGLVIANDDPQNPLGEYWIDIGDSYGLHGTIDPESIGKAESKGCIRMHAADIEEVYNFLIPNSEVVIRR